MNVLVALYADLELYPPSFNAVRELARRADQVFVVVRSLGYQCAELPANVSVIVAVRRDGNEALRNLSGLRKLRDFLRFVRCLRRQRRTRNPELVLAYDPLPLLAVRLSGRLGKRVRLWYHSHDKEAANPCRRFSLGWWAYASEASAFRRVDLFSLPAGERLPLFPTSRLKLPPLVLPNYPSRERVGRSTPGHAEDAIRLIYQGSLGRHHGFEEIIPCLGQRIAGKQLRLTLLGKIDRKYRDELLALAEASGVSGHFSLVEFVPFTELQRHLARHDIGLAIHKPVGVTYSTGGTASNKIYEYAAAGLPVILYDSEHYRTHFENREWVSFCDLSREGFRAAVELLENGWQRRSDAAMADVSAELNFESAFEGAWAAALPLLSGARGTAR